MIIKVTTSAVVGHAILNMLVTMNAAGTTDPIAMEVLPEVLVAPPHPERATRHRIASRVQYVALNPETAQDALDAIGAHTITGLIFADVANGTIAGAPVTERSIRTARPALVASSIQRSLVQLRQSGLICSQPLEVVQHG